MRRKASTPQAGRPRPARRGALLVLVPTLLSWGLAGCGDPDDGGGGGGYLTSQATDQATAPYGQ